MPIFRDKDEPTYTCGQCLDEPSGWIALACNGLVCKRTHKHAPHTFAVKCPCWLRKHADAIRANAERLIQGGKPRPPLYDDLVDLMNGQYAYAKSRTLAAEVRRVSQQEVA